MGSGGEPDSVTGLLPLSTVAWKNISQSERIKILKIYNNFNNSNPKCQ